MRRAVLVLSAVLAAVAISAFSAVLAQAQATDQYEDATGGTEETGGAPPTDPSADEYVVSRGSIGGKAPSPEAAKLAAADLAEEEKLPDYSRIVDNTTKGRFSAPGSKTVKDPTAHGGSYAVSDGKSTIFRVDIPTDSDYSVYAWWPAIDDSDEVDFSIPDGSKTSTASVDQSRDGGLWVKVGTYEMKAGERKISLSGEGAGGTVLADAVAVMRGELAAPPEDSYDSPALSASGRMASSKASFSDERRMSTRRQKKKIVRSARRWMGTPYRYATCTSQRMSCTCLTKRAWNPFGHTVPLTERGQWKYEPSKKIWRKRNIRRGDIVFFKEGGSRYITHVAIYAGNGYIVHASNYYRYKKVVESKMKYVTGYHGAIRMNPR